MIENPGYRASGEICLAVDERLSLGCLEEKAGEDERSAPSVAFGCHQPHIKFIEVSAE